MTGPGSRGPTRWLLRSASGHLRSGGRGQVPGSGQDLRQDWANAMAAEAEACRPGIERLRWAWGCRAASLRVSGAGGRVYAGALALGLALIAAYEWSADESRTTVAILCAVALLLGLLRPGKAPLSGALAGLVVAGVIGFEALSGIRPGYETQIQTLSRSLPWLVLVLPALACSILGGRIGRRFRPVRRRR